MVKRQTAKHANNLHSVNISLHDRSYLLKIQQTK